MNDFTEKDRFDNIVTCSGSRVTLKLKAENRIRNIGYISQDGHYIKGTGVQLQASKHKFREYDAWGINWIVLKRLKPDSLILLFTDIGIFRIAKEKILESKSCKMFSKQGFELQHIVPEHLFEKIERRNI